MTQEQYEGTPELIFYCEYDPNNTEDRLEIPFTNEYKIELDFSSDTENQICINVDLQPKESNIPKGFFGKNILNVTAIAGKNGVGKSYTLDKLLEQKNRLKNIKIFLLENIIYAEEDSDYSSNKLLVKLYNKGNKIKELSINKILIVENRGIFSSTKERKINYINNSSRWMFITSRLFSKAFVWNLHQEVTIDFKLTCLKQDFSSIKGTIQDIEYVQLIFKQINNMQNISNNIFMYYMFNKKGVSPQSIFVYYFLEVICIEIALHFLKRLIYINDADNELCSMAMEQSRNNENVDDINQEINSLRSEETRIYDVLYKYFSLSSDINDERHTSLIVMWKELVKLYPNNLEITDLIQKMLNFLINSNGIIFQNTKIRLNANSISSIDIENFLKWADLFTSKSSIKNIFHCVFGMFSSGQQQLLDSCAILRSTFEENTNNILILLDEPDARLHPEWSRKYLSYLFNFLNEEGERLGVKFQVILTTHSPYLISDLPKENIILLEKDEKTGKRTARKSNYGFASNFYDIMSDSFFLDDTIGEFAKQKINQVIKRLNQLSYLLDKKDSKSKKISNKFMQRSQLIFDHVNPIIQLIGDPFIKQQLDRMAMSIQERLKVACQPDSKKELLEKQRAILEAQIKQIDQELGND